MRPSRSLAVRVVVAVAVLAGGATAVLPPASLAGGEPTAAAGYWLAGEDGSVYEFGGAPAYGSLAGVPLSRPIVSLTPTPSGQGFWLVASDGGVFAFGDARFHGSTGNLRLNQPIVGMAPTPSGAGYWLVAADGGIFAFGDARFHGSTGNLRLNRPIVGMAPTPSGAGYWFVAADGGIFAFGDARFHGSTGNLRLNRPIVGMAPTPSGAGYWFVASDGGIFAFGDAGFYGSTGDVRLNHPIVGMASTGSGRGYWFVASDGGIFSFGDAAFYGSAGERALARPVTALAAVPPGTPAGTRQPAPSPGASAGDEPAPPGTEPAETPSQEPAPPPAEPAPPPPPPPPPPPGRPFEIALIGDTGYTSSQDEALVRIRRDMATFPLASVMHIGDIWAQGTACTESNYRRVRDVFDGFAAPFVYTPGDNEWTDCDGSQTGKLETIREIFFPDDFSLGQRRIRLTRQQPEYVENARWTHSGVVLATFNRPGSTDSGGRSSRKRANLEWLHAAFDEAHATNAPAVVVGFQDNPFEPSGDSFMRALKERAIDFARPVLIVHGDTHDHRVNRPWRDVPTVTRLEVYGDTSSGSWDRVVVDPANPEVFTFHTERAR